MAAHNDTGVRGEQLAAGLLEAKGYQILDRNYRFEQGEVDLVALRLDPAELVFVEVKTRSGYYGEYPEAAVTPAKQQRIFKAADCYLYEKKLFTLPVRFDIIAVLIPPQGDPVFHHIEDAFRA
ncbi:MAG: YraN family protein [Bacteroidia bacterium]|nr:YraN family protein [Bacteroidia bacterium]